MSDEMRKIEAKLGDAAVKVLRAIVAPANYGAICEEVERKTGLPHQTASARINELMKAGLIADKGIRRRTLANRSAIVWVFVPPKET